MDHLNNRSLEELREIVYSIQKKLSRHAPVVRNINSWPIVRNLLYHHLYEGAYSENGRRFRYNKVRLSNVLRILVNFKYIIKSLYRRKKIKCDFLFMYESHDIYSERNGVTFHKIKDPYYEFLINKYNCKKICIKGTNKDYAPEKSLIFYSLYSFTYNLYYLFFFREFRKSFKKCKILVNSINKILDSKKFNSRLSPYWVYDFIYKSCYWSDFYSIILKNASCKAIFTCCYFRNPQNHGLAGACDKLGINLIDIQHGAITTQFTNWCKNKDFSYSFLPKCYLCWDKEQQSIMSSYNRQGTYLKPILGLNIPFRNHVNSTNLEKYKNLKKGYILILFIHQNLSSRWNNIYLNEVSKNLKPGIVIYFHFHPNSKKSEIEQTQSYFKDCKNIIFKIPQVSGLLPLICISDICMTRFSTAAFEAFSLEKNVLFLEQSAKLYFRNNINSFYTSNVAEVSRFINKYTPHNSSKACDLSFDTTNLINTLSSL